MEYEVKAVGGIESCFVSLPLSFIQTLQSTRSGPLPPVLALELRSRDNNLWHVAWSGSSSMSSAIEVAQQLAECISVPDGITVQVRAVANLPKATLVMIEPNSEDDWEVLELNSDHAEAAFLKQVGIVYEGMRFPLWLHGRNIIMFLVVSTFPKKSVVQLVPGTEVAVAPKTRKKHVDSYQDSYKKALNKEHSSTKALLRVQDPGKGLFQTFEVKGIKLGVALTSIVFIHPETAKCAPFDNFQLVTILPKIPPNENPKDHKINALRKRSSSTAKEGNQGEPIDKDSPRHVVTHLLLSDLVAKGHVMLPKSLRLYLKVGLHSWVYVKKCNFCPRQDIPSFILSPCQFKMPVKDKTIKELESHGSLSTMNGSLTTSLGDNINDVDWSVNEDFVTSLSSGSSKYANEDLVSQTPIKSGAQSLLHAWFIAQKEGIASNSGVVVSSLVLGNETFLHFEVMGHEFGNPGKEQASSGSVLTKRENTGECPIELIYLLTAFQESSYNSQASVYEVAFNEENMKIDNLGGLKLFDGKLDFGAPIFIEYVKERTINKSFSSTISSLSWMGTITSDVINRLKVLLSLASGKFFGTHNLPFPGHVLIYGPPGSGKTSLATAVAKFFEEHAEILAHIVFVSCSNLALEKTQTIRQSLSGYISEALDHTPSLVIFDDLDSIVSSSDSEGSQLSSSTVALVEFLTDMMDEYGEKRHCSCGIGPIAFLASAQSLGNLPQSFSSSGRFDFHVQLPSPAASERTAILKHEIHKRSLRCSDDILSNIASKCDGYDAYDLEILVDRAVHSAVGRYLSSHSSLEDHEWPVLMTNDFSQAMKDFLPVAMRDITKSGSEGGRTGWEDVGGLSDIRKAIQEMVELPSQFPNIFAHAPLRLRSNVLLYGPPGCGKTHVVGAAAAACSLRFISVKGPELLNKYIGASEQAVRDIFSKAAAAAPCLLFFDEFDSIAPKRGHDNTGVTDRVVNQLLTELDGVEVLTGVFVFAATSRPDLLDAALLRPGRLDRLLFCDFPSWHERVDILTVLSRKLPLAGDIDLNAIASITEGFSGADLQALLSDAQLASVHELLENSDSGTPGKMPVISNTLLKSVALRAKPSVSEAEKQRLYGIYSQFLDSKKSVATQSRDAKGKRATLA
ncbi:PREDICTED: peroxisome biogenesis protein 1 [Nelumbo nucifera]|uniref:Peroxisomal ATPase PEX1 n=2 Tax=Nelumbo nucifera TaxID=4432 RepID=A0A1U8B0A2_NELNU|nr:PREDICTED: peroxisome biogenesis protein 1 [Nelumbo nucifera]DAD43726.1 TPA_asm: hypothetical protein HUJ06_001956 [Nelumbo nucifera]